MLLLFSVMSMFCAADQCVRFRFLKDPFLYAGLLLMILLLIQWLNAGGTLFFNRFTEVYRFSDPPVPWLPFSLDPESSRQPVLWFAPVWILVLLVRHLFSVDTLKWLMSCMLWNAAALALLGLIQFGLGWTKMFGFIEIEGSPTLISTFAYSNHGGSFFYMFYALAIGLTMDALQKHKSRMKIAIPAALSLLFAITAMASLSRAAVLAVVLITLLAMGVWVILRYRKFTSASWVNLSILGGILGVFFVFGLLSIGDGAVWREFTGDAKKESDVAGYYDENRGFQIPAALKMVEDHPWFGVGGWGYSRFLQTYYTGEELQRFISTGRANVHCDPIQFLAEHGSVGFGLMSMGLGIVLFSWRKFKQWRFKGLGLMTLCGTGVVLLHSVIDLPFRCPTVLWHWLLLLAIVPVLAGRSVKCSESAGDEC